MDGYGGVAVRQLASGMEMARGGAGWGGPGSPATSAPAIGLCAPATRTASALVLQPQPNSRCCCTTCNAHRPHPAPPATLACPDTVPFRPCRHWLPWHASPAQIRSSSVSARASAVPSFQHCCPSGAPPVLSPDLGPLPPLPGLGPPRTPPACHSLLERSPCGWERERPASAPSAWLASELVDTSCFRSAVEPSCRTSGESGVRSP